MVGRGLHTGEFAYVRVRPAHANEGRYFVIVPDGTISGSMEMEEDEEELSPEEQKRRMQQIEMFTEFLNAQNLGFYKGFAEFCNLMGAPDLAKDVASARRDDSKKATTEVVASDPPQEMVVPANVSCMVMEDSLLTSLQAPDGSARVHSVENLLAVLEASGVDNCRIELEGGREVPTLDGSAMQWWEAVAKTGVRPATTPAGDTVPKMVLAPSEIVTVTCGSSFVSLYPGDGFRVAAGINCTADAPVIGKQWFAHCVQEDPAWGLAVAPARPHLVSHQQMWSLRDAGFIKAATTSAYIIAAGSEWLRPRLVRFPEDEPARHKVLDLYGDLALLNFNGNGGVPLGQVVAYNADHRLHHQFCSMVMESAQEMDWRRFPDLGHGHAEAQGSAPQEAEA